MTFLNPAALFGLAAIGIPILIHLLNKLQIKEVKWAAMRFLRESVQGQIGPLAGEECEGACHMIESQLVGCGTKSRNAPKLLQA